jgi:hypothetical protein
MARRIKIKQKDQEKHDAKTEKCDALTSPSEQTSENGDEKRDGYDDPCNEQGP